jgi:hypothetical protein
MMNNVLRTLKRATPFFLTVLFLISFSATVNAANDISGSIAQGFLTNNQKGEIVPGSLVSTNTNDPKSVELATKDPTSALVGIADDKPLLVISTGAKEVEVVIGGTTSALVSDINGKIEAGDKITASPINGVGMRATNDSQVVGTAQTNFDLGAAKEQNITDKNGKDHIVRIGYIPVQVGVALYRSPNSDFVPPFVQNIANNIAGRPVSLIRILLCSAFVITGLIVVVVLIYGAVRAAMTSLGRNPLAANTIRKSLYRIIGVAFTILAGALLASYIILAV